MSKETVGEIRLTNSFILVHKNQKHMPDIEENTHMLHSYLIYSSMLRFSGEQPAGSGV